MTSRKSSKQDPESSEGPNAALLDEFKIKYGDSCTFEDIYLANATIYGSKVVQAFLDYALSAEPIDINTAVNDLGRFFVSCIADPGSITESEFCASDEIIQVDGYYLNMTNWENSHIECHSLQECVGKSREYYISNEERVRYLNKALHFDKDSEEALYERACYCEQLGYFNDAISDLKRYIRIADDIETKLETAAQVITLYIIAKSFAKGIEFASEWIQQYPQDQDLLIRRAKLLYRAGLIDEAMEDLGLLEELGHGSAKDNLNKIVQDVEI
jgi:tetratricopeptide (TPR) repeat protein